MLCNLNCLFLLLLKTTSSAHTDVVPVLIWGLDGVDIQPALKKLSNYDFENLLHKHLSQDKIIVVFVEKKLDAEDLSRKIEIGTPVFKEISQLGKSYKYFRSVEKPIEALKSLRQNYTRVSYRKIQNKIPILILNANVVFLDMDDVQETNRLTQLQEHDKVIKAVYQQLSSDLPGIALIYTGYESKVRKVRDADSSGTSEVLLFDKSSAFFYLSNPIILNNREISLVYNAIRVDNETVVINGTGDKTTLLMTFKHRDFFWCLTDLTVNQSLHYFVFNTKYLSARFTSSYHCNEQFFLGTNKTSIRMPGFQVEPLFKNASKEQFSPAVDCISTFTVPILSGFFIVGILLIVFFIGMYFMMDIHPTERFNTSLVGLGRIEY